jgi:hypothetical protein
MKMEKVRSCVHSYADELHGVPVPRDDVGVVLMFLEFDDGREPECDAGDDLDWADIVGSVRPLKGH